VAVYLLICLATGLIVPLLGALPVADASLGTFGYTKLGIYTTTSGSPVKCNYTLPVNAYILSFTIYINDPSPSSTEWVEVGIYNGTALIESNKTVTDRFSTGWVTFSFPYKEWFKAGNYGLAAKQITSSNSTPPTTTIYYDAGAPGQTVYIDAGVIGRTTNLPDPWGSSTGTLAREYSEYCTYTTTLAASPPTYSGITYSSACVGTQSTFGITVSDVIGLSKYIFSFDNGVGVLTNSTPVAFVSDPQTPLVNETLTGTVGATVRFRWFFNDTSGYWNSTGLQSFTTGIVAFQDTFSSGDFSKWQSLDTVGTGVNVVLSNDTYDGAAYDYRSYAPGGGEAWIDAIDTSWNLGAVLLSCYVRFTALHISNASWRNVLYGLYGYPTVGQLSAQVYNNSGVLEWQMAFQNQYFSTLSSSVVQTGVWYHLVMLRNYLGPATQQLWVNGALVISWSFNLGYAFKDFELGLGSQSGSGSGLCVADYDYAEVYLPFPTYTGSSYSTTVAGTLCTFTITYQDNMPLSEYLFSFANGTTTYVNRTWTAFTSNPQTISVTEKLNTTVGATIEWRWYANDTNNRFNDTSVQSFITTTAAATPHLLLTVQPHTATYYGGESVTFTVDVLNQLCPALTSTLTLTVTGPNGYYYYYTQGINVTANSVAEYSFTGNAPNVAGTYVVEVSLVPALLTAYDAMWLKVAVS
jgi:hypothetical protein